MGCASQALAGAGAVSRRRIEVHLFPRNRSAVCQRSGAAATRPRCRQTGSTCATLPQQLARWRSCLPRRPPSAAVDGRRSAETGPAARSAPRPAPPDVCDLPRSSAPKGHADCSQLRPASASFGAERAGARWHRPQPPRTPHVDFPQDHSLPRPAAPVPSRHRAAAPGRRPACSEVGGAQRGGWGARRDARFGAGDRSPLRRCLSQRCRRSQRVGAIAVEAIAVGANAVRSSARRCHSRAHALGSAGSRRVVPGAVERPRGTRSARSVQWATAPPARALASFPC